MRSISALGGMGICTGALLVLSVPAHAGVDARLLEMLKANGSISAAQYTELTAELDRENQAAAEQAKVKKEQMSAFEQSIAWAARTQVKGDVRVRQETVHAQNSGSKGDQNRQRIRARVGFYSQINPQVDTGIRIATGSGDDARSTNQSMDNYFDKKQLWLDQAYIDFHPTAVKNLHLIGGKMTRGFALIAWPVRYGDTGVMSFMISHDGEVFSKNLGPNGDKIALKMARFDPDSSWSEVKVPESP